MSRPRPPMRAGRPTGRAAAVPLGAAFPLRAAPARARAAPAAVSDEDLMTRFRRSSDERLFEELARRHTAKAYRAALALTGRREDAEDAVQECFLRVVRARSSYRPGTRFSGWLFAILRNVCADEFRRRLRAPGKPGPLGEPVAAAGPGPELREEIRAACLALGELSQPEREALVLRVHGGLRFAEIAEACGVSTEAAKKRVYRALDSLRLRLARHA